MLRTKANLWHNGWYVLVISVCLLCPETAIGQQTIFGKLIDHVEAQVLEMPGPSGNDYQNPTTEQSAQFNLAIGALIDKDIPVALALADMVGYTLIRIVDNTLPNNQEFFVLQKKGSGSNYWGTFIYNAYACRDVVIQCPHPRFDSNTALEGAYIFTRLKARAMIVGGTHRCNNNTATQCSGSTTACGTSAAYRISDIAHNDASIFQTATEYLADMYPDLIFIQLHGFAKLSGDPNLIISNGTRDTPDPDPIAALQQSLLDINPSMTFKIVHIDTDWTRLTAFTNTQGRYLNMSPDACSANAFSSTGRFVHIEQEFDLFRKDSTGWDLMYQGLEGSTECMSADVHNQAIPSNVLSDQSISFEGMDNGRYQVEIYLSDGRLWRREEFIPNQQYTIPENTLSILLIRSMTSGAPVFQHKFFCL